MGRLGLGVLGLALAACGDRALTPVEGAGDRDERVVASDMGTSGSDLVLPSDRATSDVVGPADLAAPSDLAVPSDLAAPTDLVVATDGLVGNGDLPLHLLATTYLGLVSVQPSGEVRLVSDELSFGGVGNGAIDIGPDGNVYVITGNGISRYDVTTRSWSRFVELNAQTEGLKVSPSGDLHATTLHGLYRIDSSGTPTLLSADYEWGGVGTGAIDFDLAGNIYAVFDADLHRYEVATATWSLFASIGAQTEGLRFDAASGDFYGLTTIGLIRVDPSGAMTVLSTELTFGGVGSGGIDIGSDGFIYTAASRVVHRFDRATATWELVANLQAQVEGVQFWRAPR